ncbi:coiled-coil domain-containing protein 81-like [Theristicus caerulescens]
MEGCCTVAVSLELSTLFPTLLHLSTKEVVAIWDAVSAYILGQLKLDKGVLVRGLGTFAMLHERFQGKEEVYVVRRPVFQLGIDVLCLQELAFPTVVIPGDVKIKPLDYRRLSRATSFPRHVVEDCVQETILLYSLQLRNRQRLSFAFKDIGVLSCEDDVLCMRFYYDCVTGLESKASRIALLHSRLWTPCAAVSGGATTAQGVQAAPARAFPRFQFQVISRRVAKALSTWRKKAAGKHRTRRSTEGRPDKLLQRRVTFPFPGLPSQELGPRQQDVGKKPSASVLPPCPGSSPRTKEAGRQEPAPPARRTAALLSSEGCKRALQEVWQLSAEWEQGKTHWQERRQQAQAEWALWEAWAAGEDRRPPQALGTGGTWTPHPPAQPRRKEVSERWRKAESPLPAERMAAAAQQKRLQPDHLSPRAVQVLRRLEPHQMQRRTFKHVAENNKRRQEQQRQLPCARCWYRSRGEGAGSGGCSSGC